MGGFIEELEANNDGPDEVIDVDDDDDQVMQKCLMESC